MINGGENRGQQLWCFFFSFIWRSHKLKNISLMRQYLHANGSYHGYPDKNPFEGMIIKNIQGIKLKDGHAEISSQSVPLKGAGMSPAYGESITSRSEIVPLQPRSACKQRGSICCLAPLRQQVLLSFFVMIVTNKLMASTGGWSWIFLRHCLVSSHLNFMSGFA